MLFRSNGDVKTWRRISKSSRWQDCFFCATCGVTVAARLEVIASRLDAMLQAVKTVRVPLDDFYAKLNDEQKAQFEAIGPARSGPSGRSAASDPDQPAATRTHSRRHHHAGVPGILRHIMSMARW